MGGWVAGVLRWLERLMFLAGTICLASVYVTWKQVFFQDLHARAVLRQMVAVDHGALPPHGTEAYESAPRPGSLIGVLEGPAIDMSVAVIEGGDERALAIAAGHLPATPLPWHRGNSAVAGHRDTVFRPLRRLRAGDRLVLATAHGTFDYRVTGLAIVNPDDVGVLEAADVDLTLITCYPFDYLGPAPRRFVVRAQRVTRAPAY